MKRLSFLALFTAIMLCMGGIGASADAVKNGDSGIFHQMVMQSSSDPSADRPVSFAGAHDMEMMIDAVDAMVPINGRATFFVSVRGEPARIQFSKDINSYIYEDTIRGLSSFARYLRAYGRSAIVSQPKQLIHIMCRSAIRTMQNYDKVWE